MQLTWNHARPGAGPEDRKPKRNGSHNEHGLEVKDALSPSGRGRKMSLTFPLIDQAISPTTSQMVKWRSYSLLVTRIHKLPKQLSDGFRLFPRRIVARFRDHLELAAWDMLPHQFPVRDRR